MAQELDPLALIAKRKAEMKASRAKERAERERLDAEAAALAKEEEEIAIAEKVFARLALTASGSMTASAELVKSIPSAADLPRRSSAAPRKIPAQGGTARPAGIPTVPQMVTELLLDAEKRGLRGLRPSEIMVGINDRWWPGVSVNMIMPTVYRCIARDYWFEKDGKLIMRLRGGQPPNRGAAQLKLSG
ncbi:MAG: hypothetical protein P4M07_15425 [Xanthobacteraceae bacterium]|nr:hypothetical protein [Xanthobacteraceae bacterium]